jgi:hypothetical protein
MYGRFRGFSVKSKLQARSQEGQFDFIEITLFFNNAL